MARRLSRIFLLGLAALILSACAEGNCRRKNEKVPDYPGQEDIISGRTLPRVKPGERVFIYKYDGSLQCEMGQPIPVDEMAKELEGIRVFSRENKNDGLMHIQVCGSATGQANVFEIEAKDLKEAKQRGFSVWTFN